MKKRTYTFKNYMKNHIWETIMNFIMPLLFSFTLLHTANATKIETYIGGFIVSIICALVRLFIIFKWQTRKII